MSQTSHISRYRPAILAITGAAAACSVYYLYTVYSAQSVKGGLHRSNAIHRARGDRPLRTVVGFSGPEVGAPLGKLVVRRGSREMLLHPTAPLEHNYDQARQTFGLPDDQDLLAELELATIECVLQSCHLARSEQQQQYMRALGLGGLSEALADHDIETARTHLRQVLSPLPFTTVEHVEQAFEKFIQGRVFNSADLASSDGDDVTYAETEDADGLDGVPKEPSQGLKGLLYHIAEAEAKRKAYEHRGIYCEECDERPIRGVRWHCLNCPDFDLCSTCEANNHHLKTHVFVKINVPLPVLSQPTTAHPLWYPGDPRKLHAPLKSNLKRSLEDEYSFDSPKLDAFYDQFTCIANVPWAADPNNILAAIDRRAFNKALTSERWPQRYRPNAIYDRMFAFYDTNNDGLIGFEEFVSGLAYLRGPKRFTPLRRALQGFDIDGDGYIDRSDFIRIFRAKYDVQKMLLGDMIDVHENEHTQAAMDTLQSNQPISSIFSAEDIPPGEERPARGKAMNAAGDMQPLPGTKTILDDNEGWLERPSGPQRRRNRAASRPPGSSQHYVSRFEERLDGPSQGIDGGARGVPVGERSPDVEREPTLSDGAVAHTDEDVPSAWGAESREDHDGDIPLNRDILWQVIEDGFHQMLDPMFSAKEHEDDEVTITRSERQKWRQEIDRAVHEREAFEAELKSGAEVDPLMATALSSTLVSSGSPPLRLDPEARTSASTLFDASLVPTDLLSLARREAEIPQRPLDELLESAGYSRVADNEDDNTDSPTASDGQEPSNALPHSLLIENTDTLGTSSVSPVSADSEPDPSMPQDRPNTSQTPPNVLPNERNEHGPRRLPDEHTKVEDAADPLPSMERLHYLSRLDEQDRELQARGGRGRLNYEELEAIVKADTTNGMRGLITSWLEWASF